MKAVHLFYARVILLPVVLYFCTPSWGAGFRETQNITVPVKVTVSPSCEIAVSGKDVVVLFDGVTSGYYRQPFLITFNGTGCPADAEISFSTTTGTVDTQGRLLALSGEPASLNEPVGTIQIMNEQGTVIPWNGTPVRMPITASVIRLTAGLSLFPGAVQGIFQAKGIFVVDYI
ncbi:hypothetical protein RKI04_24760 [Citrobacter amalonaticus]|uniref:fimbrial protein n=1 Tax=Citrobacter amalonaticus TaxID=35703 RepID=UPI00287B0981|nr:hypothetical protein [Citrobacter amalonaticus]MDS4039443.1 hypothetical protein [Citrobacter amalonaticus]